MEYDQSQIILKLNHYLKLQKRSISLTHGYCHGLTLLWLHQISLGREKWFYQTIKKITRAPRQENKDIEKFLGHIEWLQNPEKYLAHFRQMDMDNTMEKKIVLRFSGIFLKNELKTLLTKVIKKNKMVVLSDSSHTIGIFHRKKIYFLFNPNDKKGMAKQLRSSKELYLHILKHLYHSSDAECLPITLHVLGHDCDKKTSRKKFIQMILNKNDYVMRVDGDNITPLYLAAESHDLSLVRMLLKKNALPNLATRDGRLPLLLASYSGYDKIAKVLLEYGAEPDMEGREGTPLFVASFYGHIKVVKTLLNFGADVNKADRDGETPIFGAVENNYPAIVQILLKNNANIYHHRKNGETPLDVAMRLNNQEMVALLKKINYSQQFFDKNNENSEIKSCQPNYEKGIQKDN